MFARPSFFSQVVVRLHWDATTIDLAPDARTWPELPEARRRRLTTLLAGFCVAEDAVSDQIIPFAAATPDTLVRGCSSCSAATRAAVSRRRGGPRVSRGVRCDRSGSEKPRRVRVVRVRVVPSDLGKGNCAMTTARKTKSTTGTPSKRFTAEERAAMKERAQEVKAASRRGSRAGNADGESDVIAKIAEMSEPDRAMAERLHAIVTATAPDLSPKTWYGMPAYVKDGKVVCHFQSAQKFKTRYATLGFSDTAHLDDGAIWPTAFALKELTAATEARIGELVKKAMS